MVREINEDACLMRPEIGLWVVADGMGGHEGGELASGMVIEDLRHLPPPTDWQQLLDMTTACLQETNRKLRQEAARRFANRLIGSTVVILLAYENHGACLWVGDSRLYRWRAGELQQLSRDHSQVQEWVDMGLLKPEQAHYHPLANVITRAVGSTDELAIDRVEFPLAPGDVFLLCSDGLNKTVPDAELPQLLAAGDERAIVQSLIHLALKRNANDNVTVVVVTLHPMDSMAQPTIDHNQTVRLTNQPLR